MKIPTYQSSVKLDTSKRISPSSYQPGQISLDTNLSGSTYDLAAAKIGTQVFDIAKTIGDHVIKMKDEDNHNDILKLESQFQQDVDENVLYNNEPKIIKNETTGEEIRVNKGVFLREKASSIGSYDEFKKSIVPIKDKYLNLSKNDWQRERLDALFSKYEANMGERVSIREAEQRNIDYLDSLKSNIEIDISKAGAWAFNPTQALKNFVGEKDPRTGTYFPGVKDKSISALKAKGYNSETIDLETKKIANQYVSNMLKASSSGLQSKAIIDKFKNELTKEDYDSLVLSVKGRMESESRSIYWNQIKDTDIVKSNNQRAVQEQIMRIDNQPIEEKEKLWRDVESRMNEIERQKNSYTASKYRKLENDVAAHLKSGGDLQSAKELYSVGVMYDGSPDDEAQVINNIKKIESVYSLYETKDDPETAKTLEDDAQNGNEGAFQRVNDAFNNKKISSKTHTRLLNDIANGGNPRYKSIMAEVEKLAVKAAGKKNSADYYEFIYQVKTEANNDPDKFLEIANRKAEKKGSIPFFRQSQFRIDKEEKLRRQENLMQTPTPSPIPTPQQSPYPFLIRSNQESIENARSFLRSRGKQESEKNLNEVLRVFPDGKPVKK